MSSYWRRNYYYRRRRRLGNSSMWHRGLSVTHNPTYNQKKGMIMMKSPNIAQGDQGKFSIQDIEDQIQYLIDNHFIHNGVYNGKPITYETTALEFWHLTDTGSYFFRAEQFNQLITTMINNDPQLYVDSHHSYQVVINSIFVGLDAEAGFDFQGTIYWNNNCSTDSTIMLFQGVSRAINLTTSTIYVPCYASYQYDAEPQIDVHQGRSNRDDNELSIDISSHGIKEGWVYTLSCLGGGVPLMCSPGPYFPDNVGAAISFAYNGNDPEYPMQQVWMQINCLFLPYDPSVN